MGCLSPYLHSPNIHWVPGIAPSTGNTKEKELLTLYWWNRNVPKREMPQVSLTREWQWVKEGFTTEVTVELNWARLSSGKQGRWQQGQGVHSRPAERTVCARSLRCEGACILGTMGQVLSVGRVQPRGGEERKQGLIMMCVHLDEEYDRLVA